MSLNDCAYCGHTEAKRHAYPPITSQEAQIFRGCWAEIIVQPDRIEVNGSYQAVAWNTPGCTCPEFVSPIPQLAREIVLAMQPRDVVVTEGTVWGQDA